MQPKLWRPEKITWFFSEPSSRFSISCCLGFPPWNGGDSKGNPPIPSKMLKKHSGLGMIGKLAHIYIYIYIYIYIMFLIYVYITPKNRFLMDGNDHCPSKDSFLPTGGFHDGDFCCSQTPRWHRVWRWRVSQRCSDATMCSKILVNS